MMSFINHHLDFPSAARLPAQRLRYRKALAFALFLMALFSTRAFGEERLSYSLLRSETALAFYVADFKALQLSSVSGLFPDLWNWVPDSADSVLRALDSLPLDLFQRRSTRFSRVEPGFGTYFPDDSIGRSRISGAGLDEGRWFFLKFKFRF